MTTYDKLLVTHSGALRRKYGTAGAAAVRDALDALVAADDARGLATRVLLLDNTTSMRAIGTTRVADGDWVGALRAVDLAVTRYQPAYLTLVGATDVVPQCQVENPFAGLGDDLDPFVPSDLPYACDLPDGWTGPAGARLVTDELLAATRVVGRLPDVVDAIDPSMLLAALRTAATHTPRSPGSYERIFAVTVAAWRGSTVLSTTLLPGPTPTVHDSPPARRGWPKRTLSPRVHFVNCHGTDTNPDWWGQAVGGPVDIVALAPEDVDDRVSEGTVVAAECCFGAMHQAPADQGGRLSVLTSYLRSGAYAALGSTSTSYGPADGNGQADLICRFWLEGVLAGASTGRALLEARQRFVRETGALAPEDLKTLAQFDLLGDPAVVAVALPAPPGALPKAAMTGRRVALAATGRALSAAVPRAGRARRRGQVERRRLAQRAGLPDGVVGEVRSFGESSRGPRRGLRFHAASLRDGARTGFVTARDVDGELDTRVVLRK